MSNPWMSVAALPSEVATDFRENGVGPNAAETAVTFSLTGTILLFGGHSTDGVAVQVITGGSLSTHTCTFWKGPISPVLFWLSNVSVCLPELDIVNGPAYVEQSGQVRRLHFGSSTPYIVCLTPDSLMGFVAVSVTTTSWLVQVPNV